MLKKMIAVVMIAGISGICSAIAPLPPPPAKVKTQKMLAAEAKAEAKKAAELKKKQEAENGWLFKKKAPAPKRKWHNYDMNKVSYPVIY